MIREDAHLCMLGKSREMSIFGGINFSGGASPYPASPELGEGKEGWARLRLLLFSSPPPFRGRPGGGLREARHG